MKKLLVLFLLFWAQCAFTQGVMSVKKTVGSRQWSLVDNVTDCATATDCWHNTTGIAPELSYGGYGHGVIAITSGCEAYEYHGFGRWTAHPEWGCIHDPYFTADGNLYALYGPGYGCGPNDPGKNLGRWNAMTQVFDLITGCFMTMRITKTGVAIGADINGTQWCGNVNTGGWQHCPVYAGYVSQVFPTDDNGSFYSLRNDGAIFSYNSGTGLIQLPGAAIAMGYSEEDGMLWVTGTDNHVYNYEGSTWNKILQTTNSNRRSLAAYGGGVFASDPNNRVLQMTSQGLKYTLPLTAKFTCNEPPALIHLCTQFTHVLQAKLSVGSTTGQLFQTNAPSVAGTQTLQLNPYVTKHDVTACVENNDCTPSEPIDDSHCTSGAQDDTVAIEGAVGIDNVEWAGNAGSAGPRMSGTAGGPGAWNGSVNSYQTDACYVTGGVPTCPVDPASYLAQDNFGCWWLEDPTASVSSLLCNVNVAKRMTNAVLGGTSPWLIYTPFTVDSGGVVVCEDTLFLPTLAYNGHYDWMPACR